MNEIEEKLRVYKFNKQLVKHIEKYSDKRVLFYGAGNFFKLLNKNFDIKSLNPIGISDIKFISDKILSYQGYKAVTPEQIFDYKPDIVLLTLENNFYAEQYFIEKLFKQNKKKFKYKPIFSLPIKEKIKEEWSKL